MAADRNGWMRVVWLAGLLVAVAGLMGYGPVALAQDVFRLDSQRLQPAHGRLADRVGRKGRDEAARPTELRQRRCEP